MFATVDEFYRYLLEGMNYVQCLHLFVRFCFVLSVLSAHFVRLVCLTLPLYPSSFLSLIQAFVRYDTSFTLLSSTCCHTK